MSNEVKNNIDSSKNQRTTNLLTALDKAFDELNISTVWTALGPKEVQYTVVVVVYLVVLNLKTKDIR